MGFSKPTRAKPDRELLALRVIERHFFGPDQNSSDESPSSTGSNLYLKKHRDPKQGSGLKTGLPRAAYLSLITTNNPINSDTLEIISRSR